MSYIKDKAVELLSYADVKINGDRPWDIQVHDDKFYSRSLYEGSLGFGESYMDGLWDSANLDDTIYRIMTSGLNTKIKPNIKLILGLLRSKLFNMQTFSKAFEVGQKHYDLSDELYRAMLDKQMVYTCAYWKDASDLDAAQAHKLDLVCKKINLQPGQRILDVGCGWGSFAKFAAQNYGAEVVGVTISKEQVELGNTLCKGLPVEIRLQDYRDVNEKFDHIVSLGMFEHVGYKNYKTFMKVVSRCLSDDGLFLLHTIGSNQSSTNGDAWIEKYIFPNGMLPSVAQIGKSLEGEFVMEDWHNFSAYYDKTLMAWFENFDKAWSQLSNIYDEKFYRMWKFYLLSCAASFRARYNQLWQIVLSKNGVNNGYLSLR